MSALESLLHDTAFVSEDATLVEVALLLDQSVVGVIGVTRAGLPAGTITNHDFVKGATALGMDLANLRARDVMEEGPVILEWHSDYSDLIDAAILMRRVRARHAIVTRGGDPVGVVSFSALSGCDLASSG